MSFVHRSMLLARDTCVACDTSPSCNCASDENCILTSRTCSQCPTIQCIKNSSASSSSTINPGIIAGPIVAVLVIASVALFWYLRRKKRRDLQRLEELAARARKAEAAGFHLSQPNSPNPSAQNSPRSSNLPQPPPSARRASRQQGKISPAIVYKQRDPFADRDSYSTEGSARIIPIEYVGDDGSGSGHGSGGSREGSEKLYHQYNAAEAARTLDAARQNLLRPGAGSSRPARPARSPGLDLRLHPNDAQAQALNDHRTPTSSAGRIRDSYLSEMSGAASFLSGNSSDLHVDAPRIMTSKQIQVGRLQQAEMVQFGGGRSQHLMEVLGIPNTKQTSPSDTVRSDPFAERHALPIDIEEEPPRTPSSQKTFGSSAHRGPGSEVSGQASGYPSIRSLTPSSRRYEDEEEALRSAPMSGTNGDLRFSMGSLAFNRDSVSTQGTSRYLASRNPDSANAYSVPPPATPGNRALFNQARESISSYRSGTDSLLGAFPMIPPPQAGSPHPSPLHNSNIPQSSSVTSMASAQVLPRPPVAFRAPNGQASPAATQHPLTRPTTAHSMAYSVADSLLGSYPFVPPNMDNLADLPSANVPTTVRPGTGHGASEREGDGAKGRNALGMSMASEGLSGFDFSFDNDDEERLPPPLPEARR